MNKRNGDKGKQPENLPEPATVPGPKPGDYVIGTPASRAAARAMITQRIKSGRQIRFLLLIHRPRWAPPKDPPGITFEGGWEPVFVEDMTAEEKAQYPCWCEECQAARQREQGI